MRPYRNTRSCGRTGERRTNRSINRAACISPRASVGPGALRDQTHGWVGAGGDRMGDPSVVITKFIICYTKCIVSIKDSSF